MLMQFKKFLVLSIISFSIGYFASTIYPQKNLWFNNDSLVGVKPRVELTPQTTVDVPLSEKNELIERLSKKIIQLKSTLKQQSQISKDKINSLNNYFEQRTRELEVNIQKLSVFDLEEFNELSFNRQFFHVPKEELNSKLLPAPYVIFVEHARGERARRYLDYQNDTIDVLWSSRMERYIRDFIAEHERSSSISLESLVCKSNYCEILGVVHDQAASDWNRALQEMNLQPWWCFKLFSLRTFNNKHFYILLEKVS